MKDAFYFPHDSNARHDPKILAMRSIYKTEGYGWYWILIEMLRDQEDYRIKMDKYVWDALAMQMQCERNAAKSFVEDCINEFRLLHSDGEYFWSESLFKRMLTKDEKSEQAKNAANKRWEKHQSNQQSKPNKSERIADAMPTHSERNAKRREEKIVEESRREEITVEEITTAETALKPFEQIMNTYLHLRRVSPVHINAIDRDIVDKLSESEIPPDFVVSIMVEVSKTKEINSMRYYDKVIRDRWDKHLTALEGGNVIDLNSRSPGKDRADGDGSQTDGYYSGIVTNL